MSIINELRVCQNLSASCKDFATTFHKILSNTIEDNIVSSPLSVHMILSLLSHGTGGTTLNEFTSSLHHEDKPTLNDEFKSLISLLNDMKEVKLYIANAMYIQEGFPLLTEFVTKGTDIFHSLVQQLDFKNNVEAAGKINGWVKEMTNDKIADIVSAGDFDEYTKLVLVNAIYFKGHWLHGFDVKNTQKKAFHVTKTQKKIVPTMFKKSSYDHGVLPDLHATFIEIPYLNEDVAMIILLPDEVDGLQSLQDNFEWGALEKAPRITDTLELYLPRFKFEATINLKDVLRKIGLNAMFEDSADFSRLSEVALKVSKVLHKAVIEVNEEGTEAAAATVVQMRLKRMIDLPEQFLVDRPFMFIIEHKPSSMPLFVGCVRDINISAERDEL